MNKTFWKKIKEIDWNYLLAYLNAIIAFTKLLMGGEIMGVLSYVLFAIFWILCSICTRVQDFMEVTTELQMFPFPIQLRINPLYNNQVDAMI